MDKIRSMMRHNMFPPEHIERMHDPHYHEEQRLIQQCEESVYDNIHNYLQRKKFPRTLTKDHMKELQSQVRSEVSIVYAKLRGERLEQAVERLLRQGLRRTHTITTCEYKIQKDGLVRRV